MAASRPTGRPVGSVRRNRFLAACGVLVTWAAIAVAVGLSGRDIALPSPSEQVFIFAGRGFGHGVGMSQYGARGAARAGLDAPAILAHYYRGTAIERRPGRDVRVLLAEDVPDARLAHDRPWVVTDGGTNRRRVPAGPVTITRSGDGLRITAEGGTVLADGWSSALFDADGPISLGERPYRGRMRVLPAEMGVRVVNVVPLEQYLRSVVAREMPPSWGDDTPAALQVQAIAARSYAIATASDHGDFDLYDDQRSQVYGGVADEDPRSSRAVAATSGQVLTSGGNVIVAYYSASSGGHTEDGQNVFPSSSPTPYLTGVEDPYDADAPLHRWRQPPTYTGREIADRLGMPLSVIGIAPRARGASPRVLRASVWSLPFAPLEFDGPTLRAKLMLPDTWFDVVVRRRGLDGTPLPVAADAPRSDVWLAVVNGSGVNGAAGRIAERAESLGYRGVFAGDAPRIVGGSIVYAAAGAEAAAERAAADLQLETVLPLADAGGRTAAAPPGAQVIVLLAR